MKHTLCTLSLSLALLPLAAADSASVPTPSAPATPPQAAAEQAPAAGRELGKFECTAVSRPLAGGGTRCVAGAGEVMHIAHYASTVLPTGGMGSPAPVPDNRVTRALNRPESAALPHPYCDDMFQAYWAEDALIPADKVLELWYGALEKLSSPVSWFCDESGDNLVIISGLAACCRAYEMYLYQWNEEKQGFERRGVYTFVSRLLVLDPTRVEFLPEGMRVSLCYVINKEDVNILRYQHLFRYTEGKAHFRFPDEELRWKL